MAVVTKKEEKAETIIGMMTNGDDVEEFKKLFKEAYPDDYSKMFKVFNTEERKMPHPETYLSNMYKVAMKNMNSQTKE